MKEYSELLLRVVLISALTCSSVAVSRALAQDGTENEGAEAIEEIIIVGSRRPGRTAKDSPVPVDIVVGDEFQNQGSSDMDDLLRNLLPSYNVTRYPISDAATITRPATLRTLPPDSTLILVNGKRRHRASVIAEFGGSLAAGSQGPDVAVIPPLAIDSVQVLRDGASAQYGSDAIAGVINFVLKNNNSGFQFDIKSGEYYAGDGLSRQLGVNWGLPLGPNGFANLTLQVKDAEATSRSLQKTNAVAQIATGNSAIRDPVQVWGSPEVKDDVTFFINSGIDLSNTQELYAFGNYSERKVTGGFFYRNPDGRSSVFTQSNSRSNRAIIDLSLGSQTGQTSNCPVLLSPGRGQTDQAIVDADAAALAALPTNCWVANTLFPGGYTPVFGADVEDIAAVIGMRGTLHNNLGYDFSMGLGRNESAYRISNTWNPSLGPDSPTSFALGKYIQTEQNYNADFNYPLTITGFYSDLNLGFGAEYRVETFQVLLGEQSSWEAGDWAFQSANFHADGTTPLIGMSVGSHGFAGFGPSQTGEWDRGNIALYGDVEADITKRFLLGLALRYENFDDFGSTVNSKIAGRYRIIDELSIRGSYSTGFRVPTPGQSNVTKVSTVAVDGELLQRGQIPPTNPVAQFLGAEPLKPEDAKNITLGGVWDVTNNLTLSLDLFQIELTDRIASTGGISISAQPVPSGVNCPAAANLAQCLEELGTPGASDLSSVSFFTNDFDTTTQGIDLVASYVQHWEHAGSTNFSAAWNRTRTKVDSAGNEVSRNRIVELEHFSPQNRGIFTVEHKMGDFRFLSRASFYGDWTDAAYSRDPDYVSGGTSYTISCETGRDRCYNGEWIFDLEAAYTMNKKYTFILGAQNVFDQDAPADGANTAGPDLSNTSGGEFTSTSPWGIDGAFWYLRFRVDFD